MCNIKCILYYIKQYYLKHYLLLADFVKKKRKTSLPYSILWNFYFSKHYYIYT